MNPLDVTLRTARAGDLEALLPLVCALWRHEALPWNESHVRDALRGLLADPSLGRVFWIDVAGAAAGYAVVGFGYSLEYGGRDAMLDELYLAPEHRGGGRGGCVMALLETAVRALGVRFLHLEVDRGNAAGQALYTRRGFAGKDRLFLTKRLDAE